MRSLLRCRSVICAWAVARNLGLPDDLAVAGGEEPCHSDVDADPSAGGWERLGLRLGDDDHIPAAMLPLELQCLHPALDRSMLVDLESSDRLEARTCPAVGVSRLPLGTVPGHEEHLVEPLVGLEPRVADLVPPHHGAPEEGSEGCVEPAEGLLLGGEGVPSLPIGIGLPDLPELGGLVAVADRDHAHAPGVPPFLKSGVVQVAVVAQQPDRAALLRTRRVGAELVGASHDARPLRLCASSVECPPSMTDLMRPACRRHVTTSFGAPPRPRPDQSGPPGGR